MSTEIEPLDADVLALLRAERPIVDLDASAKAGILAAVEARVALPPMPGGGGGGAGGGAAFAGARVAAALAVTFAVGIVTGVAVAPRLGGSTKSAPGASASASAASATAASAPRGEGSASSGSGPALDAVPVGALPAAAAPASAPRAAKAEAPEGPAPSARGLGAERGLLDVARGALARGEAAEALTAVDRHAREYPDGALVEEREALAIKSLVALGRRDEARARAQRFEQRFPNGLLLRTVKGAVGDP